MHHPSRLQTIIQLAFVLSCVDLCSRPLQARADRAELAAQPGTPAPPDPDANWRWYGSGGLAALVALPFGPEGARWTQAEPGFDLGVHVGVTPIPVTLGLDLGFVFGTASKVDASVYDETLHRDVDLTVKRSVSMFKMDLSLRLQPYWPYWFPVRPYCEGLIGFQVTSNDFSGTLHEQEVQWNDDYHVTGALGWGFGVDVLLGGNMGLWVGMRRYYGPSILSSHALLLDEQATSVQYGKPTQLTQIMVGLVGVFKPGG